MIFLELKECFKICDKSGKGYVTPEEFKAVMQSVGHTVDNDDIREIFLEIDDNSELKDHFFHRIYCNKQFLRVATAFFLSERVSNLKLSFGNSFAPNICNLFIRWP